ncbi:MCE family protein [Intrasporangium sp. DVR]|uniref:MCE family protein n=1 Tax=Intrasporangium sp. DVR TaxID=3127867 RepID=UPI00313A5BAB
MPGRHRRARSRRTADHGDVSAHLLVRLVVGLLVVGLVAGGVAFWPKKARTTLSADFTRAVGLYPGSDVRILGVKVGQVDAVEPQGRHVHVTFSVDGRHRIPADAKAAIVAPSLVSDRYVQLLPVWSGGPQLADGTRIPLSRTAVPVELDRVSQSLDDLMVALGPDGANRDGALSALLETSAANLDGNGDRFHQTVRDLSAAVTTLSDHRGDVFGTVKNLQTFTTMLADNNAAVRRLNSDLATVALQLREERDNLRGALEHLGVALDEVSTFVKDNRSLIKADVDGLVSVTSSLVEQRQALAEALENAPAALSNLSNAYHPETGTLDTRNNAKGLDDPVLLLCSILTGPTRSGNSRLCDRLKAELEPRLPRPAALPEGSVPGGRPGPGAVVDIRGADPTLGGLLGGAR